MKNEWSEQCPHILICGQKGAGKSTLISRLLTEVSCPLYGYVTKRLTDAKEGLYPIYMHSVDEYYSAVKDWARDQGLDPVAAEACTGPRGLALPSLTYNDRNRIAWCNGRKHDPDLTVFNTIGADSIEKGILAEGPGIIVMDEIGFLESKAVRFTEKVYGALDGDRPVLATVKLSPEVPFLREIKKHPKASVFEIREDNREELFQELLPIVRRWNERTGVSR